jgi:hypothetical protein
MSPPPDPKLQARPNDRNNFLSDQYLPVFSAHSLPGNTRTLLPPLIPRRPILNISNLRQLIHLPEIRSLPPRSSPAASKQEGNRHLEGSFAHFKNFLKKDFLSPIDVTENLCERFRKYLLDKFNGDIPANYFSRLKRVVKAASKESLATIVGLRHQLLSRNISNAGP